MNTLGKIQRKIKKLKDSDREKVLHFLEKLEYETLEVHEWEKFSLDSAMRDLENDNLPDYSENDLK
jgi:mRNA-degrading endonuclease RelE of RelBE toxin-antitoxin system